jgi:serine/threonine protein kinase
MRTYCGTPLNMAPEIMNKKIYTYKADIWSVGVLIFLMLSGDYPYFAKSKD